eukprot:3125381-Amphidinium_carterae.1
MFAVLAKLNFVRVQDQRWGVRSPDGQLINLVQDRVPYILHLVRSAMRCHLLHEAIAKENTRPNLQGCVHCDVPVTVYALRAKGQLLRSELICLLCDGLWTASRLCHAGFCETDLCVCGDVREDTEHVLWFCPLWHQFRNAWPAPILDELRPCDFLYLCKEW